MSDLPRDPANPGEEELDLEGGDTIDDEFGPDGGDEPADEAEADEGAEEEAEGQDEPVGRQPRSRGATRFQNLSHEVRDLKRQLAEARTAAPAAPAPDPQAQARAEAEFLQQLQMMEPAQAALEIRNRERQLVGGALQQVRAEMRDEIDRRDYDSAARSDKTRARLAPEVNRMIAEARRGGNYALDRNTAFFYLRGKEADERAKTAAPGQRRAGSARVAAQRGRPGGGRSDAATGGRRTPQDADEALLRGVTIGEL